MSHSKILDSIFRHSVKQPGKAAFHTTDGHTVTYKQLADNVIRAASFLYASGIRRGDRIMLSAQKEIEFVYLYFGAHLAGVINVVVDSKSKMEHLRHIISVVKPAMAFGIDTDVCISRQYGDFDLPDVLHDFDAGGLSDQDTADIMFTSGTTGNPKGVILTHHNVFSSADNINRFIGNTPEDIELLGLPMCHSFGLGRLRCNMLTGATVILHNGFANIKSVFSAFEKFHVTGFGMVPAVWAYIKRLSGSRIGRYSDQIKYIEIGSAAMPLEDKELLCSLFPSARICMHYGLTEASRAVFMEFHENIDDLATAGKGVVPGVDVKILREDGSEADPGEEGEICVRGNMVTPSYFLPEDNENAFIDGYFRTGDWGRKSELGNIYLVARKKELINVGGKKVSPIEIEEALEKAGVGESMCVSVPDPDGVLGEVPKALLVEGTFDIGLEEIKKRLAESLETYKLPKIYEVVKSVPKTASGKKQRTV
ncbi:MAG: acyl--CoA ligase [Bacteroides sp.]|nr:acyl--CoA ligase [Bacteroides sp.]